VDAIRPQRKRTTEKHLEKDLERKMWTAGFRFNWRKMETAAQDTAELDGDEWSVAYAPLGVHVAPQTFSPAPPTDQAGCKCK